MTAVSTTFESGTLAANVGTGAGFNSVNRGTGATFIYDDTHVAHGTKAGKLATSATSATVYGEYTTALGTQSDIYFRFNIYLTAAPPGTLRFFQIRNGSGGNFELSLTTGRALRILNVSAATVMTLPGTIPLDTWVRIEGHVTNGASGTAEVKVFTSVDSEVAAAESGLQTSNFGATTPTTYRIGVCSALASVPDFWIDDVAFDTAGWLGPVDRAPTLTMPSNRTAEVGETVSLTASASDPEGTGVTYAWSFASKPTGSTASISGGSTATASFAVDRGGTYTLQCVATDGTGKTTTGTVVVTVAGGNFLVNVGGTLVPATMTVVP